MIRTGARDGHDAASIPSLAYAQKVLANAIGATKQRQLVRPIGYRFPVRGLPPARGGEELLGIVSAYQGESMPIQATPL